MRPEIHCKLKVHKNSHVEGFCHNCGLSHVTDYNTQRVQVPVLSTDANCQVFANLRLHSQTVAIHLLLPLSCSILSLPAFSHQITFSRTLGDNFSVDGCDLHGSSLIDDFKAKLNIPICNAVHKNHFNKGCLRHIDGPQKVSE